jgi:hypothetical protein
LVEQVAVEVIGRWLGSRGRLIDQSATGLPDFTIDYADGRTAVGEVSWHADPQIEQMWGEALRRDTPQEIPLDPGQGTWGTQLVGAPNITRLYTELPTLIARLNAANIDRIEPATIPNAWRLRNPQLSRLAEKAAALGISYLSKAGSDVGPGHVTFFPPFQPAHEVGVPDDLPGWIEDVLAQPRYADVSRNLLDVTADERHIFVMAGSATPAQVETRLQRLTEPLTCRPPALPAGVTHIWLNSRYLDPRYGHVTAFWSVQSGWRVIVTTETPTAELDESSR